MPTSPTVTLTGRVAIVTSPARIVKKTVEKLKVEKIEIVGISPLVIGMCDENDITLQRYAAVMDTNVRAPIILVQAALPHIPSGGHIINIFSFATRIVNISPGIPPMSLRSWPSWRARESMGDGEH
ncbi:hypothetical protein B0H67DRAFT_642487 [Lasiosphaeris hirsuta]|uniref:Uncharacterized protein n=1 Tax=Lasiosphaeris hirsuta TaxID=260670 RepID=A0AA40ANI1_9PEZI|nr:hypothetical protein B0H67DRAFT_642487 [Lasiosphaeris hirsuta]